MCKALLPLLHINANRQPWTAANSASKRAITGPAVSLLLSSTSITSSFALDVIRNHPTPIRARFVPGKAGAFGFVLIVEAFAFIGCRSLPGENKGS